jgi:hypothetical protein
MTMCAKYRIRARQAKRYIWTPDRESDDELTEIELFGLFLCVDCGEHTGGMDERYMVHDAIWEEAGGSKGMLCVGCLEARLGRQLMAHDFMDCPLNRWPYVQSDRLKDRMTLRQPSLFATQ